MDVLRRPAVMEDAVTYRLFLVVPDLSEEQKREQTLQAMAQEIMAEVAPLLIQYIWQNQPFSLKYYPEKGGVPAHIGGYTQFGDNVEDEWFIVYLLQRITRTFPKLAASVEDNDGQFLLIEAADHLPKWLNPESSENRVFLFQGELHILPVPSRGVDIGLPRDVTPSLTQALAFLSTHKEACLAIHKIRSSVEKRLQGYPERIRAGLHHAHCFVPAGIAGVLAHRPDLLAPAVSAFYLRDPLDLQACRTFQTFPPETRVLTMVTFTRCLYAQLLQQRFTPDRRSGFTLPAPTHPQHRAHELGMKLAHGFEILCSKCRQPSTEPDAPVSCSPLWKGFLDSLTKNDYFRGEMVGSVRYRELMTSAENFFRQSVSTPESVRSPGQEVLQVLQSCPFSLEELRKQEAHLPPEDSDSWLDMTPQDLERLLEERAGRGACSSDPHQGDGTETANQEESGYSLVAVTQGMKKFINTVSSHEGAELPWSLSNEPFSFDPNSVAAAFDRLLGGPEQELDSDDLDDDDDDDDEDDGDDDDEGVVESEGGGPEGVRAGEEGAEALGKLQKYMAEMDQELMGTNIGQSFTQNGGNRPGPAESPVQPGSSEEEEILPLDVDLNLVTNLLESLSSQAGLAGPASNLLQSLGIHLPPNADR
ncbi:protein ecdysoneless homolog [Conger conger]|uniref:protein ecdysoneless homolog n=1 Tax=Conger conger TaxID=82655 RepID=UPI002A5A63A5|nr:protein ecdysoneless homolog [Conger conger]XP_061084896.1 protein ecdysoneless homolog [Conger conger]XP_061084897.1 protein ecdysoneless homolog [Conger conger]XP_061084898.1 protein ecdysoneless homolog [Conger conger]